MPPVDLPARPILHSATTAPPAASCAVWMPWPRVQSTRFSLTCCQVRVRQRCLTQPAPSHTELLCQPCQAGGPSIRAYHAQVEFCETVEAAIAAQQRTALAGLSASCWLGLRLQLIAAALAAAVATAAVAQHSGALPGSGTMAAGLVGLSLRCAAGGGARYGCHGTASS